MNNEKNNKTSCAACSCPCEAHKEHNHPVPAKGGEEKHEEAGTRSTCGQERKPDDKSSCDCT